MKCLALTGALMGQAWHLAAGTGCFGYGGIRTNYVVFSVPETANMMSVWMAFQNRGQLSQGAFSGVSMEDLFHRSRDGAPQLFQ
jgi:hypothetical protein